MDSQQPNGFFPSSAQPQPVPPPNIISSNNDERPPRSYKKIIIFLLITVILVCSGGGGYVWYQYSQQQEHARIVAAAQAKADKEAALERQGTVQELEDLFEAEAKQETDADTHLIFNAGDSLQREASAATTLGTNNATSL